jgi:ribosomal protein S24E
MEEIKIISEKENPLFRRKELVLEARNISAPKTADVGALLAEKFSADAGAIKIERIIPRFGSDVFTIQAKIYKTKEDKESIEPKAKVKSSPQQNQ